MDLQTGFERPAAYRGCVVSIGNFDGVHLGHQQMARTVALQAQSLGARAVILTFDPHPASLLAPMRVPPRLTTMPQRAALLEDCGIDCVIAYPTDHALLQLSPDKFFRTIIVEELQALGVIEGPNFHFGHKRAGNIETLRQLCSDSLIRLQILDPVGTDAGQMVSSTEIRKAINEGQMSEATRLLGRPYSVTGVVRTGARRGRQIGFPTANLEQIETLLPTDGVYAGRIRIDGTPYRTAVHIGPNVTFNEQSRKVEAHILDYAGDLYGQTLELEFLDRIRGTERFADLEQLKTQLNLDVTRVRAITHAG